ncbi:MAG: hypothetical protein IPM45_18055 [Acidimicrobiales bacterium]|nr:hypothetical protein [Acidimicrobiales bacterium]
MSGLWGAEYWQADGVDLEGWRWLVESVEDRIPARVGSNIAIPGRRGSRWQEKRLSEGGFVMTLFVTNLDADGDAAATAGERLAQAAENLDALVALVASVKGREVTWTRRRSTGPSAVETLTGLGEVVAEIPVVRFKTGEHRLTLEVVMADPCWYGDEVTEEVVKGTPLVVTMPGSAPVEAMTVTFAGPLTNPVLTNTVYAPDLILQYTGTIGEGDSVVLDVGEFTALAGSTSVIDKITHSGSARWMELVPGTQTLTLTADAGTGTATLAYQPPYLI